MNKEDIVKKLPKYFKDLKANIDFYSGIDERLYNYLDENLSHPERHNLYETLAVTRFMRLSDKYNFNISRFKKFVRFYESLAFPSEKGLQCFRLTPVQVFQFASINGFENDKGYRLVTDALLYVPRKFSKTTSVAAFAIYDLMFGDFDSQAYVASNSFNQAKICFDIIYNTLKPLDPKMNYFKRTKEKIYSLIPGRTSFIQCLSSSPDKLDGLNASTIILDEYASADSAALKNVLTSSQGIRKEPLIITITTASTNLEGPFNNTDLPNYKKILEGTIEDDTVFASIFEPDNGDDYSSPETWKKVQPHIDVTVTLDFYQRSWVKALRSADDLTEFKTKLLNVFTPPTKEDWIAPQIVEKQHVKLNLKEFTGHPICMVSVDLSVRDDISAVSYGIYDSINKKFYFYQDYYLPKETIEKHPNCELYRRWVEQGYLKIAGESVIDYEQIGKDIIEKSKYVKILAIGYDSYKNKSLTNYLKAAGVKVLKAISQTYSNFTSPVEIFETSIYEGNIFIDENPINGWMIRNCIIDEDNMGNRKPVKMGANRKIDGAICILMNINLFSNWKR